MYPVALTLGAVLGALLYGRLCDANTMECFRFTFQSVPVGVAAIGGLLLYGWRFIVVNRIAKQTGKSADYIVRNSNSPVRRLGISFLMFSAAWVAGSLARRFMG